MSNDIYSYIEENFNIKITDYQFKRDYIKEPLKKIPKLCGKGGIEYEKPYKEDLEYLYITLNLKLNDIAVILNIKTFHISRWLYKNNIKKDKKQWYKILKKSLLKKYGDENYSNKEQTLKTKQEKYGEFKNKHKLKKIHNHLRKNLYNEITFNIITRKENLIQYIQSNNIKTIKELSFMLNVSYNTMKKIIDNFNIKHHLKRKFTFEEDKIYKLLCQKYTEIKRQYKSDLYPFACDFYIPEIDTYIEYQGFWTHGKEPYIGTDKQKEKLKLWESKNTPQYNKAIDDWTNRDVLKRKTAKNNGLKWIEFFSFTEFEKWFNE